MNITHSAAILLSKNVKAAAEYFRDKVGFTIVGLYGDPPNFAIVGHGHARLMLAQVGANTDVIPNWKILDKTSNVYFWVDDIHSVYETLQQKGATIDFTLYKTPWGMWEFGIQDLDGHDISFGQLIAADDD